MLFNKYIVCDQGEIKICPANHLYRFTTDNGEKKYTLYIRGNTYAIKRVSGKKHIIEWKLIEESINESESE